MLVLSHRGFWLTSKEKNTILAFERSFHQGFGLETDIRDYNRELVISHDTPNSTALLFDNFLKIHHEINPALPLALNVKADGLQKLTKTLLDKYEVSNYFMFDMSIPDTLGYLNDGMKVFSRQSEYEPTAAFYEQAEGIWLDGFQSEWWSEALVQQHLENNKKVCIVSPELHRRPHLELWEQMKSYSWVNNSQVMLCTDFPQQALEFFHG